MSYNIISFEGGGIGGIFSAMIMKRLLQEYPELLKKTDMFSGTSIGGMLALYFAAGKDVDRALSILINKSPAIFKRSLLRRVFYLGNIFGAKYCNTEFKKELEKEFGDMCLEDLSTHVLIPAFHLSPEPKEGEKSMWHPTFFHNFAGNDSDGRELVVDIALRTSAAPTLFPSYDHYIDGAVAANDPAMCAIAQVVNKEYGNTPLQEIKMLSIGTGFNHQLVKKNNLDWGLMQYAPYLMDLIMAGSEGVADFQCRQLLGDRYIKVDSSFIQEKKISLDSFAKECSDYLQEMGESYDVKPVVDWLKTHW